MLAIRENEERAKAVGYNTFRYKLGAFAISAFFAGVAGGLLAGFKRSVAPEGTFYFLVAGDALLAAGQHSQAKTFFRGQLTGHPAGKPGIEAQIEDGLAALRIRHLVAVLAPRDFRRQRTLPMGIAVAGHHGQPGLLHELEKPRRAGCGRLG